MTAIATTPAPASTADARPATRRAGLAVTGLVGAFLLVDAVVHVVRAAPARDAMGTLGYPPGLIVGIGVLEALCVVLYLVPRTAPLGAVLLTGYLGGAVSAQLRIEAPLFATTLFPVYVGVAVWVGVWLRDARVRRLLDRP